MLLRALTPETGTIRPCTQDQQRGGTGHDRLQAGRLTLIHGSSRLSPVLKNEREGYCSQPTGFPIMVDVPRYQVIPVPGPLGWSLT